MISLFALNKSLCEPSISASNTTEKGIKKAVSSLGLLFHLFFNRLLPEQNYIAGVSAAVSVAVSVRTS